MPHILLFVNMTNELNIWSWGTTSRWVVVQSVFYHLYNQVSYMSLDQISPLTFSIGNTMKRISVIVSSIIIFHTPVQPINALGAAIAILGTFLYSQVILPSNSTFIEHDMCYFIYVIVTLAILAKLFGPIICGHRWSCSYQAFSYLLHCNNTPKICLSSKV